MGGGLKEVQDSVVCFKFFLSGLSVFEEERERERGGGEWRLGGERLGGEGREGRGKGEEKI